jgi:hypothetical protein
MLARMRDFTVFLMALLAVAVGHANAQEIVWHQPGDGQGNWGPAQKTQDPVYGTINAEVADDIDMVGTVNKVAFAGYNGSMANPAVVPARFYGVYVRFYAYGADGKPGALQAEYWVPKGDARLTVDNNRPDTFTTVLQPAFQATGKHFVATQVVMDSEWYAIWYGWSANTNAPKGQALFGRDLLTGSGWGHSFSYSEANADLAFTLYGTRVWPAPTLASLSDSTIARSGRLTLTGENFGNTQGAGGVTIGGVPAHVVQWTNTVITCYVPEGAPPTTTSVQVTAPGGLSNALPLTVTLRPAQLGRVRWRFQAHGLHILHRPAIGPDGTIYALDAQGLLYALTPDGGLKWVFRSAGGDYGPASVGPDGTVYVASDSVIYAVNPDGTEKWRFAGIPGAAWVIAGPSVGPDGNIYAVNQFGPAYSLTPQGTLRWTQGYYAHYGSTGREIVFGAPGHLYFALNMYATGFPPSLFGLTVNGSLVFQIGVFNGAGIDVAPDATVIYTSYAGITAITPTGQLKWNMPGNNISGMSVPTVGIDGNVYAVQNSYDVYSTTLGGALRWHINALGVLDGPVVSPANHLIIMPGRSNYGEPGYFQAVSTGGAPLWKVDLPFENGNWTTAASRARFSGDGQTAYFGTVINDYAADPYCYVYAIDTSGGAAPGPVVTVSGLTLNPTAVTGGRTSTGTVTLSGPAPTGGAIVSLSSSDTTTAVLPSTVSIPAGGTSATFTVTTGVVTSTRSVTISAAYGGVTRTATLTVNPGPSTTDTVSISQAEYLSSKRRLRVQASSTSASAVMKAYVTSTGVLIGTLSHNGGGKYSGQFACPANPANITVRSSLGGSASRAVTVK